MSKEDWGTKRICPHCGTRYYDMKKKQPACPSCGAVYDPEALIKARRGRPAPEDKTRKPSPQDEIEDLPAIEEEESEDSMIEDADELGDDDIDVEEVVEVEDENNKDD